MSSDTSVAPLLKATSVEKRFGELHVLQDISFTLDAGEAVGIVGPNGAGKTTFLSVLVGAQKPSAGVIEYKGRDITQLPASERVRLGLVRTHQIPRPFGQMTVFENALVAATQGGGVKGQEANELVLDALQLCKMENLVNRRAETLGLMDRKRLELVRAVSTRPEVLLLDEIGGGLTDAEAHELVLIIKELQTRAIAIVWIEHLVNTLLRVAKRLICLDSGRIIADGDPQAVLKDPAVTKAYLGGHGQ